MIKEILKEAFILKSKGYYKHAIEAFYKALEIDSTSLELLLELAEIYYLIGDEERALSYIEQILDKSPTHIESLKLLKQIFKDKSAWNEAEQTAKNIYCISKQTEDLTEILYLLNLQGKFNEVFEYDNNTDLNVLYQKAYATFQINNLDDALKTINKVLEQEVNNKNLLLKGKILYKMNKKDECIQLLEEMKIEPTDSECLSFAGLVKQHAGDYKTAIKYFLEAAKLSTNNDEHYYNCASTYFKMGENQLAKKYYNLAISTNPENQNYHFALANLYYSEKNYKRALEELNYDFFEARLLKMIVLYDSGYLALAKLELEQLEKFASDNNILMQYKEKIKAELLV